MRASRKTVAIACACAALATAPLAARAANCKVTAPALVFGPYDPMSGAPHDVTATVSLDCSKNAAPVIHVGTGGSGTFAPRQMQQAATPMRLSYNLYVNAGRTQVWGDGSAGTFTVAASGGKNVDVPVYARIAPGQRVPAGPYADTLTITVLF
jgi:spore coat protein U-like protein